MFDRIFDFIESVWEWLLPFVVIDAYEGGIVLSLGIPRKRSIFIWRKTPILKPGLHWMWPLGLEQVKYDTIVRHLLDPVVQSLTSKDNKPVTLQAVGAINILDVEKFLIRIDSGDDICTAILAGAIQHNVARTDLWNIHTKYFNDSVMTDAYLKMRDICGAELLSIDWYDKATGRSLRLWTD